MELIGFRGGERRIVSNMTAQSSAIVSVFSIVITAAHSMHIWPSQATGSPVTEHRVVRAHDLDRLDGLPKSFLSVMETAGSTRQEHCTSSV